MMKITNYNMTPTEYFSDSDEEDEELLKARADGYKSGIMDMYHNIDMVANLCEMFPVEDRLEMFLTIIRDL